MKRRAPKGAAASIIVLYSAVTLMMLTVLGFVTGRLSSAKEEVSAHSDAVVLTMSEAIKRRGPQDFCNDPAVQALLREYGGNCPQAVRVGANAYRIDYQAREMNIEIPTGFFDHQNVEVTTGVTGQVRHEYVEVEERRPKFVLVMDYSGSMSGNMPGGQKMAVLKQSINGLLGRNYKVDYGAVLFNHGVIATVPIRRDNEPAVRAEVNSHGADGGTNYEASLAAAMGLFNGQPNNGYYVLFATDGLPNTGDGGAQAAQMWNRDITLFTLYIGERNPAASDLLRRISGPPQRHPDPQYAFQAEDAAALRRTFDRIIGFIVCRAPAPSAEVAPDREHIYISVEANGRETGLERVPLAAFQNAPEQFDNRPVFSYIPDAGENGEFVLNQMACQPVLDGNARIVLRYERPGLAAAQ